MMHLPHMLQTLLQAAFLNERRCALCHAPYIPEMEYDSAVLPATSAFCPQCRTQMQPWHSGYCPRCGQLYADQSHAVCAECLHNPPPWQHIFFYSVYAGALRMFLLRGKFRADCAALHLLGKMLAEYCTHLPEYDALVPVPLHRQRLRERGFNQSLELSRALSKKYALPIRPDMLERSRATPHQVGLDRQKRLHNLAEAFTAHNVQNKRILLVDDVLTTGTTLRVTSATLLQAGATCVDIAVIARTAERNR